MLRVATYNTELARDGPGLLLRDIVTASDPQVEAIAQVIATLKPDVIVLQNVDYDLDGLALAALRDRIAAHGHGLPHLFALPPNTGIATGLDMNGDGQITLPHDAQSFGAFEGQSGMALLSRYEIVHAGVEDHSRTLWKDLPDALLPITAEGPFPSQEVQDIQRLSTVGHWMVPVQIRGRLVHFLTFHASPPVFDGPEDRNGRRNHDEIMFARRILDGKDIKTWKHVVVLGNANLDPVDGEGRKEAIRHLLSDPRLQDTKPKRMHQIDPIDGRKGDPALHTVAWPWDGPGHKRVSYILTSLSFRVVASGVYWPRANTKAAQVVDRASRHRLVWADIAWD